MVNKGISLFLSVFFCLSLTVSFAATIENDIPLENGVDVIMGNDSIDCDDYCDDKNDLECFCQVNARGTLGTRESIASAKLQCAGKKCLLNATCVDNRNSCFCIYQKRKYCTSEGCFGDVAYLGYCNPIQYTFNTELFSFSYTGTGSVYLLDTKEFFTPCNCDLLVTLDALTATVVSPFGEDSCYAKVEWETAAEIDNAGFNLWRFEIEDDRYINFIKLNNQLIPSKGGIFEGAVYSFEDFEVVPGKIYFYVLEDVDFYGDNYFSDDFMDQVEIPLQKRLNYHNNLVKLNKTEL